MDSTTRPRTAATPHARRQDAPARPGRPALRLAPAPACPHCGEELVAWNDEESICPDCDVIGLPMTLRPWTPWDRISLPPEPKPA